MKALFVRGSRSLVLAALVCLLAFAGCSAGIDPDRESARKGGSITVALPYAPESLDPAVGSSPVALRALWLMHTAPLTFAHVDGVNGTQVQPALARKLPTVTRQGRRIRFQFRRGLRYSDGSLLRADDFERAIKRALVLYPRGRELFGDIEGAEAYAKSPRVGAGISGIRADERTLTVTIDLDAPSPTFLQALALPVSAPVSVGVPAEDRSKSPPPGIGAYRLGANRVGRTFTLLRDRHLQLSNVPAGNADEIVGEVVSDRSRAAKAAIDGFVDATEGAAPISLLPDLRSKFKDRYVEPQTLGVDQIRLDSSKPPFNDRAARQALAYALDHNVLSRLSDGLIAPTCNLLPPDIGGYKELDPCPFGQRDGDPDLVRAGALMQGVDQGSGRVLVSARDVAHGAALETYVVQTLHKLGVDGARRALTATQRRRAGAVIERRLPLLPSPQRYFTAVDDPLLRGRAVLQALDGDPRDSVEKWTALDREAVEGARVIPYAVETVGVLLSERLDATNCRRYSPVYGLDWSSLCLR